MGIASPAPTAQPVRDAATFGGLVPCAAVCRSDQTVLAVTGLEHFRDGAVLHLLALSDALGIIDCPAEGFVSVRDDTGAVYDGTVLTRAPGLGHLTTSVWLSPQVGIDARFLSVDVSGLVRINPVRGGQAVERALPDGPWTLDISLRPPRTVVPPPAASERRQRLPDAGTTPARTRAGFRRIVPVGQARIIDGDAVCAVAAELYQDRWLITLAAFGSSDDPAATPVVGRARISAWDDHGQRYRATPLHSDTGLGWSRATLEMVPPLRDVATTVGLRLQDIPRDDPANQPIREPATFAFSVTEHD